MSKFTENVAVMCDVFPQIAVYIGLEKSCIYLPFQCNCKYISTATSISLSRLPSLGFVEGKGIRV